MTPPPFLLVLLTGILILLLVLALALRLTRFSPGESGGESGRPGGGSGSEGAGPQRPCPLCRSLLNPGERVKAVLFPPSPAGDRMQEIQGCPRCWPPNRKAERICPVCGKRVPDEGVVIARVFQKPGKTHVHVLGCTDCYKNPLRR